MPIELTINERSYTVDVPPETPLLWVLRDVIWSDGYEIRVRNCPVRCLHSARRQ